MSNILDTINDSLQEVEEQLLAEFDRIRNTLSDARFQAIDPGIKNALSGIVVDLHRDLEGTGDINNLQLMTEQHEVLLARIAVLRQLLNSKVPTAFLHEAHEEVVNNRRILESKVDAKRRQSQEPEAEQLSSRGFMGKLKGMFGSEKTESSNHSQITPAEQKALEPVTIYLDNGIYSASRELAALANVFTLPLPVQQQLQDVHEEKMREVIKGKASFGSRDLSSRSSENRPDTILKEKKDIAQSPDEIRKKLEARQGSESGKASFSSKEIDHVEAVNVPQKPRPKPELTATEIAANRRAALEAEKAKQPTTGKASFLSQDIEPVVPQEVPQRRPAPKTEAQKTEAQKPEAQPAPSGKASFTAVDIEPIVPQEVPRKPEPKKEEQEPPEPTPKPSGKAVFESRELTKPTETKR